MKIMLLHASAGAGHKRAAEALASAFRLLRPDAETRICDILDFTPALFRKTYADGYLDLVRKMPELWGYIYSQTDRNAHVPWRREVRSVFNKISTVKFQKVYRQFDPDIVVCTHFMPLQLLTTGALHENRFARVFCQVTDFAVHALWIFEGVETYYVAIEEARRHLIRAGQSPDRVKALGIPIDPVFETCLSRTEALTRLDLPADLPAVLILSGGCGIGPTLELIRSFEREKPFCRLLVVAGSNEQLRHDAEELAARIETPVSVYGFVRNIDVMMDACELIVTKPGGLTSSEALAKSKPMLIVNPIPGQEQRNCEVLLESGAAARLFEVDDACHKIRTLLSDPPRLQRMSRSARDLSRPSAARTIAADILS